MVHVTTNVLIRGQVTAPTRLTPTGTLKGLVLSGMMSVDYQFPNVHGSTVGHAKDKRGSHDQELDK